MSNNPQPATAGKLSATDILEAARVAGVTLTADVRHLAAPALMAAALNKILAERLPATPAGLTEEQVRIDARLDEYEFICQMISGVEKEDWYKRRIAWLNAALHEHLEFAPTPAKSDRIRGEEGWLIELSQCNGDRDKLRSVLRAFYANLKTNAALAAEGERTGKGE
jgi:hypothetical protein